MPLGPHDHMIGIHARAQVREDVHPMKRDAKKVPKRKSRKGTQPTSTGKRRPNVVMDNWLTKLQKSRIKFDDDQAEIYLLELSKYGLKLRAAKAAGVCLQTVANREKNDPDFGIAREEAMETYNDKIGAEVRRRGVDGFEEAIFYKGVRVIEPVLDDDGAQVLNAEGEPTFRYTSVLKFSDRMLEMESKRTNPAYRDKQTIDLNATGGGVLVAPAGMSAEEYIKACEADEAASDKAHEARMAEFKKAQKGKER